MTKQAWLGHMAQATGIALTQTAECREAWQAHKNANPDCPECAARRRTRKATAGRQAREEAYKSAGLVKVRGALGGVYWE